MISHRERAESYPPHPPHPPHVADAPETATVTFQVIGVEPVHGRGRLIGLAIVEAEVGGVAMTLQGCQVIKRDHGSLEARAPVFRHPRDGRWLPALILPDELRDALGREVLASFQQGVNQ